LQYNYRLIGICGALMRKNGYLASVFIQYPLMVNRHTMLFYLFGLPYFCATAVILWRVNSSPWNVFKEMALSICSRVKPESIDLTSPSEK